MRLKRFFCLAFIPLLRISRAVAPCIVTALRHAQQMARLGDRNVSLARINELKPHRLGSLANKAVAFFKRSRSARRSSFSQRNRAFSVSRSSCRPDKRSSSRKRRRHAVSVDLPTPRSCATSSTVRPLSRLIRTASRLKSSVNLAFAHKRLLSG